MQALSFDTHGEPTNPAIMLVHGFMSCNAQWMPNLAALGESYLLVMVELWGHGRSPTPNDPDAYSIAVYIREFERIRKSLGIGAWHLIGQSYGAGLALNYAHAHAHTCRRVVVTNSRSAFGAISDKRANRSTNVREQDFDPRRLPFHPVHARRIPSDVQQTMIESADAMSQPAIEFGGALGARLGATYLLEALGSRLLITNGIFEKAFQSDLETVRARLPNLNVADIDGGHSVNIDAAAEFNRAVLAFLE